MRSPLFSLSLLAYRLLMEIGRYSAAPLARALGRSASWDIAGRLALPRVRTAAAGRRAVWIHAASLGEAKLVPRFIEAAASKHPEDAYVLTATTRAGVAYLTGHRDERVIAVGFLPIDAASLMSAMLRQLDIKRIWLMETELWPGMISACMRAGVPVGIANARLEEKSLASYRRLSALFRPLFAYLDPVFAQTRTYAERFERLGVRSGAIHVTGNLKSAVTVGHPAPGERRELRRRLGIGNGDFVVTAGCVHPGEGAILRDAVDLIDKMGLPTRCIIVPRHLRAAAALIDEVGSGAIVPLTDTVTDKPWRLCLIARMGVLDDLYKIADAAFVGGTFVDVGGHNVWEPVRWGVPVFFGPDYHTQTESCTRLLSARIGFSVDSAESLARLIFRAARQERDAFLGALRSFADSAACAANALETLMP